MISNNNNFIYRRYVTIFGLKVLLKRNFRMWDFYLIIKFEPYLEILPTFFYAYGKRKLLFQPFEVDRLSLKSAAIVVTSLVVLLSRHAENLKW